MDVRTIPHAEAPSGRRPGAAGWMLAAPMFAWLAVFVIAPTVILFVYSFCQRDEMGELVFSFSLENYARVFDSTILHFLALYLARRVDHATLHRDRLPGGLFHRQGARG
jgi:spermidine/putrescine transport system permease protein